MKTTITRTYKFRGCYDDCPHFCGGYKTPKACHHLKFGKEGKEVVGYEGLHNKIPEGKYHPDWCPVAKEEEMTNTYEDDAPYETKLFEEIRCLRCVSERLLRARDESLFVDYQMEKFSGSVDARDIGRKIGGKKK